MRSATESLDAIMKSYRALVAIEAQESSISRNFNPGTGAHGERDQKPRGALGSAREMTDRTLDSLATVIQKRVLVAKAHQEYGSSVVLKPNPEWEAKRKAALRETDASPVEVAFLFGYTSDRPVRELRIRNGRDQHTGRIPSRDQRPLTRRDP